MSEVLRQIPERLAHASPKEEQTAFTHPDTKAVIAAYWNRGRKARRQTWADVEKSAEFRAEIHEAVQKWWEKEAAQTQETVKMPWWVWVLAFLGSILTDATDDEVHESY